MTPLAPSDPHRLGRYWLAGRLGAGGQGVVYEAYGEGGERVAVKVPRFDSAAARARLAKEASAARRVASFCTARVIEAQVDVAAPYIVSEFVPGPSLRRVVAESGPFEGDRLRRLAIGVATALTAIHRVGIVHRDLKPDNIILGPDGPRVIDFGVAREVGPTTSGPLMGTPQYMSPELFHGRRATEAADMWAWGMVVLFAARGRDAITGGEPVAVIARVLGFRPGTDGLPDPLGPLVAAALAEEPADRPSAQTVLLRLVGDGEGDPLTRGGTLAGTLRGAEAEPDLGAVAEELYGELTEAERASVPEVFLRMIDGDSLRPVTRDELPEAEAVDALLTAFAAAGIVARDGTAYELARPGLVQAWPRLREWVAANREGLRVHRRLAEASALWESHGRKPADLLHGSNLDRILRWAATERRDLTLARREREFLDAAARQTRRQSRRRGLLAAALAVLLVAALGGLGLAEYMREQSNRQRDDALARELALRAADLRQTEPPLARLLTVAAWRLSPSLPETRGALYDSLSEPTTEVFTDPYRSADSVYGISRDGRTLVAVQGGRARVWDVTTHRQLHEIDGLDAGVRWAAISPDGRTLALQYMQGVRLWDVVTGRPRGDWFGGASGLTNDLEFDRTGRLLALPKRPLNDVRWWDISTRKPLTTPKGVGLDAVSADGRLGMVTHGGDGRAQLWDLKTGKQLPAPWLPSRGGISDVQFSADGRALALTHDRSRRTVVTVYSVPDGATLVNGDSGASVEFGFGDRFVATWEWGNELIIRRRSNGAVVLRRLPPAPISDLRFDEKGRALRLLSDGGVVHTLDVSMLFDRSTTDGGDQDDVLLYPSARVLAAKRRETLTLWDVATGRPLAAPIPWRGEGAAMAFSRDGGRLAFADDATVHVVQLPQGAVTGGFRLAAKDALGADAVAFSPDGRTLAVSPSGAAGDLPVELLDLQRGTSRIATGPGPGQLAFRPDGRLLLGGVTPHRIDPRKAVELPQAPGAGQLEGPFAFSPDGRQVAIFGPDRITLWNGDLTTRLAGFPAMPANAVERVASLPAVRVTPVERLVWSPDGRTIAAYEGGARIRLWDVPTRRMLGALFDGLQSTETGLKGYLAFSSDSRRLYSVTADGTVRTHELGGDKVAAAVCRRAGRTLTAQEWSRYLGGIDPFALCP
ncbi:WD40 repeat domain-containing serine/threonine-protein kinase [Nonomuraea sp. NPDC049784]|uniref:WD40 repeat domain-containing serine/threonine-protein kinase n=1 Tax=Nonomuraea sp. NPDC049784 TaxID=3154361 RepID=UPI0033D8FAA8